jgi:hypothetical protein
VPDTEYGYRLTPTPTSNDKGYWFTLTRRYIDSKTFTAGNMKPCSVVNEQKSVCAAARRLDGARSHVAIRFSTSVDSQRLAHIALGQIYGGAWLRSVTRSGWTKAGGQPCSVRRGFGSLVRFDNSGGAMKRPLGALHLCLQTNYVGKATNALFI